MTTKNKQQKKSIKRKEKMIELEPPTEKFFISLPSGITVAAESTKESLSDMANFAVGSINNILTFNEQLNAKVKHSYLQ